MTDNRNRTVSDVRHAFSKYGGNLGTDGSVAYLFKKLGLIHISKGLSDEKLMDLVIESGALDYTEEEEFFEVTTEANSFNDVLEIFKKNEVEYINAQLSLRAEISVDIDHEMSEKVLNIMEFMDDLDDVQEVHTNAEFPHDFEVKDN
jgi:transcriptional/translational regulatory protein YebC/TACO1